MGKKLDNKMLYGSISTVPYNEEEFLEKLVSDIEFGERWGLGYE